MIKQVATILGNMAHEVEQCGYKDPALGLAIKQATLEVCQLSQERVEGLLREMMSMVKSNYSYAFLVPSIQALWKKEGVK